jgi:hypothetical protein
VDASGSEGGIGVSRVGLNEGVKGVSDGRVKILIPWRKLGSFQGIPMSQIHSNPEKPHHADFLTPMGSHRGGEDSNFDPWRFSRF